MDINFDSTGGTGSVTYGLRCNGTVSFSTSATWIKNMRYGNGELTFTVDGNTVSSERTGAITPSVNGTPCPDKVITVKQGRGSACVSSVTRTYGTGQANVGSCGGNVSVSIPYTSTTTWSGTDCPAPSTSTGQITTAVTVSKNCENTEKIITGNNYRITQAAGPCSTCNCTAYRYETRYPDSGVTFDNCGGNEILSVTVRRQCVSPQSEEYEDYTQHTVYWDIDGDSGITLNSTQGTEVTLHADSNCTEDSRDAVIGLSAYTDDNEELVIGTINVTQEPGKCSTCECPESVVTSGDSGVTYYSIRNINIGEIGGADSIGCSGGTVTVSGASIGANDYDKYYISSSITYDCNDSITYITTNRINLGDEYKETINLPVSSYTIDGIDCDNDSGDRQKEFTYEYIYYDENNAESSITTSFTVNQDCECEDCDEYIYSIGHNSTLNFDDCGNHLEFNRDYSLDGHPITSITTNGTSVKASVYSARYSCVTKDDKWISYTPKVVWELDGGESRYAILNGDTSITSVTSSATMVSVNAEYNGDKYQDINVYVYGYGKDSERIIYSGICEPHRDKFCIPGECHKCELNVNFNGLNGSTIHRGERFTVSGTSMICSFVKSGNNGDVDSKLIWDPVIVSVSPSGYVEISNDAHDDNTSGFSFDVSLSNTCQSSMNGLVLTVSQSGETDCHESVTFNVECGSGGEFTATRLYDTGQCSDINWIGSTGVSGNSSNFIITGTSSDDNGNYVEPVLSYPPGVQNKKWLMNVTHTGTSYTAEIYFEGEYDGILSLPINLRQYENGGTYFPVNASLCKPVLNCYNWIDEVPPQSFPSAVTLHYGVERGVTPTYTGLHCPITIMAKVSGNTDDCQCSDNSGGHFIESGLSMNMSISGPNMTHVFNASELPWECNDHSQGYCYPGKVFTEFSDYGWNFEEGENVKIIDTGSADIFNYKFVKTLNRKKLINNVDENVTEEK